NLHASRGLQLELTPMRSITGRVVTPDGKAGIANVSMIVTIALTEELDDWRSLSVVSEDGGRFRIPFPVQTALEAAAVCAGESDRHPFSIQMNLLGTDHYSGAEVEMDLTSLEDPWVVGDIPVAERSILSLRVLTQTGEPIAGAVAEGNAISEPTDVEGRTLVSLPNGEQQIPVMAAGYRTTMTDPIPPGQASAEVVLAPTNRLTVRFQLPESVDRSSWKLRLMSEGEVFEEGNRFFKAGSMRRRLGVLMSQGGGKKGGGKYAQFHLPEEADVLEIWGLEPRVPITCAIADEFGQSFVSSTPVVLGDATHLELNLVSPFPPRHLQGRVVDGSGVPLPGAHVMVWGSANTGRGDVTDKEGRFDFGAIAVESIFLDVKAEGYGTYRKEALLLPTEGDEIRIVLREPREVVIRVSDPFGNRVDGTDLRFGVSHEIDYPVQEEVGVFRFASLPQDDCEIQWTIGGQSGSLFLEEGVQEYDLVVPAMGSLRVHLTTTPSQDKRRYRLVLEPTDAAATEGYDPNRGLHLAAEATAIRKTFAQQLPGQYRATLLIWVKEDGRYTFQSIADLGEVQVAPDIETELSGSF
ncbi:MAG: carboxypeptidase-like regulatory domain-containing protein, partial [Planctomycetota bacterium]